MAEITDALRCMTAQLTLNDLRRDRILISKSFGMPPHWHQEMVQHIPEIHSLMAETLASLPSTDHPIALSRHFSRAVLESSRYVQETLKPKGICDIMQFFLLQTPTRMAGFGMARHERHGLISDEDIESGVCSSRICAAQ